MKKCPYCGREYSDDVVRCLIDDTLLSGGEPPLLAPGLEIPATMPPSARLTDRQMRIIEVVLVCVIAFGANILSSIYHISFTPNYENSSSASSGYGIYKWVSGLLREASALALLWYVLMRRGKSFLDLGFTWAKRDFIRSVVLRVGGALAFYAVYGAIYAVGLTAVSHKASAANVDHYLFSGGVSILTIGYQFLNPFFEELIARAYVMTEVTALTNSTTKAIIVSTALQTSYHFYQGAPAAFSHGATFLIWSIYFAKTKRVAPIILAHLYSDVGNTLWYLFPLLSGY